MYDHENNTICNKSLSFDSRNHSFNVGIAIDYSPTMALWLGHLAFWAEKNLANNKHIYDGLVWCYDTLEALRDYFPYFTKRQIERLINNSVELGLVKKGNYNQTQYDRTCWYALTPKALFYFPHLCNEKYMKRLYNSISPNGEMDYTIWRNGYPHLVTPIPNTDPNTDPNNNKYIPDFKKSGKKNSFSDYKNDERFMRFYNAYPKKEDPRDAYKAFKQVIGDDDELLERIINDIQERKKRHSQWQDKQFIKYPAVYLRKGEFEGEIINFNEESEKKKKSLHEENEKKIKKQEELSLKKAQDMRNHEINKQKDKIAYQSIQKQIKNLDELKKLKTSLGIK